MSGSTLAATIAPPHTGIHKANSGNMDLYSWAGIRLSPLDAPDAAHRLTFYLRAVNKRISASLFVLAQKTKAVIPAPSLDQTSFDFVPLPAPSSPARPTIVRLATRQSHVYLDYGVYDVMSKIPGLAKPALKLEKQGIYLLGLLVQLSEDEVRLRAAIGEETLEKMKQRLAIADLSFGMQIPWWNREFEVFCQGH